LYIQGDKITILFKDAALLRSIHEHNQGIKNSKTKFEMSTKNDIAAIADHAAFSEVKKSRVVSVHDTILVKYDKRVSSTLRTEG